MVVIDGPCRSSHDITKNSLARYTHTVGTELVYYLSQTWEKRTLYTKSPSCATVLAVEKSPSLKFPRTPSSSPPPPPRPPPPFLLTHPLPPHPPPFLLNPPSFSPPSSSPRLFPHPTSFLTPPRGCTCSLLWTLIGHQQDTFALCVSCAKV